MSTIQERYRPLPIAANSTVKLDTVTQIAGFLATVSGTLTIVDSAGVTVINAVPVTAGLYTPAPFIIGGAGGGAGNMATATTAGGAAGTLGVA